MSVQIRLAERRDAAGIRSIYNHYVTESTALFDMVPRTLDEQVLWIDEHSGGHPAVVAVVRGEDAADHVVGFGSLSPFRPRPAYSTTVENSVYLLAEYQGRGVGRLILDKLLGSRSPRLPLGDRAHRRRQRRVDRAARGVRLRARGHRARGRPEVRPLARRRGDAAPALSGATGVEPPSRGLPGRSSALPLLGCSSLGSGCARSSSQALVRSSSTGLRDSAAEQRRLVVAVRSATRTVADRGHVHRLQVAAESGAGSRRGRTPCAPGARRRGTPRAAPGTPVSGTRARRSWGPDALR